MDDDTAAQRGRNCNMHTEKFCYFTALSDNFNLLLNEAALEFFSCKFWKTDLSLVEVSSRIGRSDKVYFKFPAAELLK